jgi:hypothetical protein
MIGVAGYGDPLPQGAVSLLAQNDGRAGILGPALAFMAILRAQIAALLDKTARAAENGEFELFKTTQQFDSTASHPQWLG